MPGSRSGRMSRVLFLAVAALEILHFAGPLQAFHEAVTAGANYEIAFVGEMPDVRTAQGIALGTVGALPHDAGSDDIIVIPDGACLKRHRPLVTWIRRAYDAGATVISICVGAFVLGAAGILDGKDCT